MGKKKDKEAKSKKKKDKKESALEAGSENVEALEAESDLPVEAVPGNNAYVEYVTTEDVMELVNSLDQNLDQLDKSTQALQQQIARNQQALQRQLTLFKLVSLILVIGIFTVGYTAAKSNSRATNNVDTVTNNMLDMRGQIDQINVSIDAMSGGMSNFDNKLNVLSANVAGVNKIVNQLATDVGKISTNTTTQPYDPWRTRQQWR